jgi:virginiamycin A acetyltransferase
MNLIPIRTRAQRMSARNVAKRAAFTVATIMVSPVLLSYWLRAWLIGADRALEGSTQLLAQLPGISGQYLRRAFLARVLAACHRSATIEFGTLFSKTCARIDENVYIGPGCYLGAVHLERDVLLAAGVHVPSGRHTHAIARSDVAIRDQAGLRRMIRIGAGTWIGAGAVIMADVGRDSIVGAGAVVTKPVPDRVMAAGVPARVRSSRRVKVRGASPIAIPIEQSPSTIW